MKLRRLVESPENLVENRSCLRGEVKDRIGSMWIDSISGFAQSHVLELFLIIIKTYKMK